MEGTHVQRKIKVRKVMAHLWCVSLWPEIKLGTEQGVSSMMNSGCQDEMNSQKREELQGKTQGMQHFSEIPFFNK